MSANLLFVYGTLRRDSKHPMHQLLADHGVFVCYASGAGTLYELDGYPGMVEPAQPQDRVQGEIWRLHDFAGAIALLDQYEECSPDADTPGLYSRLMGEFTAAGKPLSAWYYRYNGSVAGREAIASGDYIGFISRRAASAPRSDV